MKKLIFFSILTVFLPACTLGPDFLRPIFKTSKAPEFINKAPSEKSTPPSTINRWWERINDPILNSYVDQLLRENLELMESGERIVQAYERSRIQRADFAPSISADTNASRSFIPGSSSLNSFSTQRLYTSTFGAELNTSWQIDLFGKIRRSVEAADANVNASILDRQALTHSLIAQLLNRRIAISINKALLDLAVKNAKNRENISELVKRRYDLGVRNTTLADIYLAEENFTSVFADINRFKRALANETYALDVLLGQPPGSTTPLTSTFPLIPPPLDVPLCLPANLLDRRPDLRASELRLKAANADIGVAIADLYPALNLSAALGFSADETSNFFTIDQLAGSILASLTTRLFEGGKLRANIRLQESEARELAAGYAQNVLEAVREVETALKAEYELTKQLESMTKSAKALRKAEKLFEQRYIRGILTIQEFLDIQQRRYAVEQNLLSVQQERWLTRVSLYMALGGDWLSEPLLAKNNQCEKGVSL